MGNAKLWRSPFLLQQVSPVGTADYSVGACPYAYV